MHDVAVYVKERLSFAWDISLGNYVDSYLYFLLALLDSVSYFFFVCLSSLSLCIVFDALSFNMNELLSIKPSANVFVLEEFNVHHKDWLAYSGETDRSSELCYNFSVSKDLSQMVNFPTWILDCDSHSSTFLDLFLFSEASICSGMVFPPLGNFDHIVAPISIDFPSNSKQDAPFHCIAHESCCAHWVGLCDHLRDVL